jgi:hypothetical protein
VILAAEDWLTPGICIAFAAAIWFACWCIKMLRLRRKGSSLRTALDRLKEMYVDDTGDELP